MIRHGVAPFLECSSRGDKRFSAFFAHVVRYGDTIENIYQGKKVFPDGSTGLDWRAAKGRRAVNQEECAAWYSHLWDQYIFETPPLIAVLRDASGLSDMFGQPGHCCQATELWRIRNASLPSTTIVNIRHQQFDVRIDRSGPYGNRYILGQHGNRATVIAKHEADWRAMCEHPTTRDQALACLRFMKGKRLGCHCKPLACHGDNYVRLIAEFCP